MGPRYSADRLNLDPELKPETIKPRTKREQPSRFRLGEMTRGVWTVQQMSDEPLTVRGVAERMAEATGLNMASTKAANQVVANVRNALARPDETLSCEMSGKEPMRYRVCLGGYRNLCFGAS